MIEQADRDALKDTRRPAFAFRVAISGARKLPPGGTAERSRIEAQVRAVLAQIHARLLIARKAPDVRHCYDATQSSRMTCYSPLADGADRVFARAVLELADNTVDSDLAVELRVVIPFDQGSYEATFGGVDGLDQAQSAAEFAALLKQAATPPLVIDGDAAEANCRHESYEAVGRMVARNCDVLMVIWAREAQSGGRGGASDIVRFALHAGIPVWCIDSLGMREPVLWTSARALHEDTAPEHAHAALNRLVDDTVIPPPPAAMEKGYLAEKVSDPMGAFFDENMHGASNIWLFHSGAIGLLRRVWAKHPTAKDLDHGYTRRRQTWGDSHLVKCLSKPWNSSRFVNTRSLSSQLSESYQYRYRTSYLFISIFGAIALISAVIDVGYNPAERIASVIECVALFGIAVLVLLNGRLGWHRRYVDYRLLSELVRPLSFLAPLGWSLPFNRMRKVAVAGKGGWVPWLVAAYVRAALLPCGALADTVAGQKERLINAMIGSQLEFHVRRKLECSGANAWFDRGGSALFGLTMLCVFAKIALLYGESQFGEKLAVSADVPAIVQFLGWVSAVAPALSAAAFGMKAYEEFESLAESSEKIIEDLAAVREQARRIKPDDPLASQLLAETCLDASLVMLSEASGWAQMLRAKAIEAA